MSIAIAIDGPAGAGKSSLSKEVAKELSFIYVDTGALYRTIGLAASRKGKTLKPFLDDFAQLIGPTLKTPVFNPSNTIKTSKKVVKALGNRNAVLVKDNGAVCVAKTGYDAEAVEIVMDKGCKTFVGTELYSGVKPINQIEAHLMRFIYQKKYSKKAGK